jgi:hypothetical protein
MRVGGLDFRRIEAECGLANESLRGVRDLLTPLFHLLCRETKGFSAPARGAAKQPAIKPKRGKPPLASRSAVERPEPKPGVWEDPASFRDALNLHMYRHGDTQGDLFRAVQSAGEAFNIRTVFGWCRGKTSPRTVDAFRVLERIERRYRLPRGYFKSKLPNPARALVGHHIEGVSYSERRRIAWHLPDDFDTRPLLEQGEIISWIRNVIISGTTEYRQFHAKATKQRFAVSFSRFPGKATASLAEIDEETGLIANLEEQAASNIIAPKRLACEMDDLIEFKTATLTAAGFQRIGVWADVTAEQKIEHFGLMFGALAAPPKSAIGGLGIHPDRLTFGLLAFPRVWDWYLLWRERRRGFYTAWELDILRVASAMSREGTGWMRQKPALAEVIKPVLGLISEQDIELAKNDWDGVCETLHQHVNIRVKEIQRVVRVHRDPFEPILPVLEADNPLAEYRKIADEIERLMPDEKYFPLAAAEAVRSYLMLRLGMHLGLRQKNMRQLLIARKGQPHRTERALTDMLCGELRWSDRQNVWEVFIPSAAFKNATSSFFANKPFRLLLPDLGNLYRYIDSYINVHRAALLRAAPDPGTFFIKTVKRSSANAAYDQTTFYEAWRLIIQRYGIFNPYTGRGAIKGLLPHGPHNVRDVLATHVLKKTGSFEQASYAIQDTPDMVVRHYGRFLPKDKAALAAQILNRVWEPETV